MKSQTKFIVGEQQVVKIQADSLISSKVKPKNKPRQ